MDRLIVLPKAEKTYDTKKVVPIMTDILLTGQESTRELLTLRRDRKHERRIRQAAVLTDAGHQGAERGRILPFPAPEYPRIA